MSTNTGLPEATIHTMLRETLSAIPRDPNMNDEDRALLKEAVALTLATLAPRDPAEAMLAQRIVVAHHCAMECLRRAADPAVSNAEMLRLHARHVAESNLSARLHRELRQLQGTRPVARPEPKARPAQSASPQSRSEPAPPSLDNRPTVAPTTPTNPPQQRPIAPPPDRSDTRTKPPLPLAA
jgi:hypothetical protein